MTPAAVKTKSTKPTSIGTIPAKLVNVKISLWQAYRIDRAVSNEVADKHKADKKKVRLSKNLLLDDAMSDVTKAASRLRQIFYKYTLPWNDEGARVLPNARHFDFLREWNEALEDFKAAVKQFIKDYPQHVLNAKADADKKGIGDLWKAEDYPATGAAIADKFGATINVYNFPSQEIDVRVGFKGDELKVVEESIKNTYEDGLETIVQGIFAEFAEKISHLFERLSMYRVTDTGKKENPFRDATIENIRELLAMLPVINVTNSDKIIKFAKEVEDKLLKHSPETLRENESARIAVKDDAKKLLDKVNTFL